MKDEQILTYRNIPTMPINPIRKTKQYTRTFEICVRYSFGEDGNGKHYSPKLLKQDIIRQIEDDLGFKSLKVKLLNTRKVK